MPPPSRQGWGQVQELQAPPHRCRRPPRLRWRSTREDRCAGTGGGVSGIRALVAGVVLLVLESALDYPGLVATAGALNPLDVLIIGGQDGLQLQLEGVRLHFGVCIYHRALVIKCWCIDIVLERNRNRVDDESIQM